VFNAVKEFAWSFSALERFNNCPKQYYHISVAKDVKDEGNEFTAAGQETHLALFQRIVRGKPLPLNYRYLESTAVKFVGLPGETSGELKFAMSRSFEPVQYFDRSVYVRVVVDLLNVRGKTAIIIDWKTGKPKPGFTQLELTAAVLSTHLPEIETFKVAYVWLQDRRTPPTTRTIKKSELVNVWNTLLPQVNKIEDALKTTTFPAKPSGLCRFCPVTACPHWRAR
jgi:hypothetical protein